MTIEELICELPFNIYKEHELQCYSCGTKHKENCRYELKVRILPHHAHGKPAYRYLAFYECSKFSNGENEKYIGRACGFGQATLEEAVKELKGILNEKQENNYAR